MEKKKFTVGIMHGHSDAKNTVEKWIKDAGHRSLMLVEDNRAAVIFERLRNRVSEKIHCVVIILSGDDRGLIKTKNDKAGKNEIRARQSVIFEMGYCFGAFDSLDEDGRYPAGDAIILMKEKDVEEFEVIKGLTFLEYTNRTLRYKKDIFRRALEVAFDKARARYPELR